MKPWKSLENYQIYRSFDERERKKGRKRLFLAETAKNLQKVPGKIGKRCSSQKSSNFIAGDERPGQRLRFEPQQAMLWQIWPKSPKKCQMRKFPKKNFFSSSKKGLKRWKKWLRSGRKRFRRGEIEVRGRKRKMKKKFEISTALMGMKERQICQSDNTFCPPAQKVGLVKVASD